MDKKDYDLFTLRIHADDTIEAILTTYDNHERRAPDGVKVADSQDLREDIDDGIMDIRLGNLEGRQKEIRRLGRNLYRAIFPDKVGEFFEQALQTMLDDWKIDKNRWLRIIVEVHPRSTVSRWPLEFLYCPSKRQWLGTARPFIALSRRITHGGTVDLNRQVPPLRVLIVISKPHGLGGVMAKTVLEEIGQLSNLASGRDAGEGSKQMEVRVLGHVEEYDRNTFGIDYLDQPARYVHIRDLIVDQWRPHVFHFIGHGKFEQQEGSLGLIDDGGEVDWCSTSDFMDLFNDWKPRLVLLQACESATSGTEPGFMSLADRLFMHDIPAVVAMQFAIANSYAIQFAKGFYEALRDGKDVDAAVQIGRLKISDGLEKRGAQRDFGAPVLFTYKPDAIIQPLSSRTTKSPSQPYGQSQVLMKAETKIEKARRWIQEAQSYLESIGEPTDQEQAAALLENVLDLEDEQLSAAQRIVSDALECLRDMRNVEKTKQTLERALRRVGKALTVDSQLTSTPEGIRPELGSRRASGQWDRTQLQAGDASSSPVCPKEPTG